MSGMLRVLSKVTPLTRHEVVGVVGRRWLSADRVGNVVELTSDAAFEKAVANTASGKMMAPVFSQLSRDHSDVSFYKVDIDQDTVRKSIEQNEVSAVDGRKVAEVRGADKQQLANLVAKLRQSS